MLEPLGVGEQVDALHHYISDPRGCVPSGVPALDKALEGGGFGPGELVLLGGRTGTRKTTVALNIAWSIVRAGYGVGWIGLDEADPRYVAKFISAMSGASINTIREGWDGDLGSQLRQQFDFEANGLLVLAKGGTPTTDDLDGFLLDSEVRHHVEPRVLFVDYLTRLYRDKYDGGDVNRIPRLVERLKNWTLRRNLVVICLHQVARYDEGMGAKYHGERPMTIEGLKYGGEEDADVVLSTYRPSKDPIGLAEWEAVQVAHPKMEHKEWLRRRNRVQHYRDHTFLQLLKNRPGEDPNGFETLLKSVGSSMQMIPDADFGQPWKDNTPDELEDELRAFGGNQWPS